jgi:hypothetical protein
VRAKDHTGRREIERSIGLIRMRLAALLGNQVVQRIEVTSR